MSDYYRLEGREIVPCADLTEYARWRQSEFWRVARETVAMETVAAGSFTVDVSTVFLGIDHRFGGPEEKPVLFETMIFGEPYGNWMWRWCTYDEAEAGHNEIVRRLKAGEVLTDDGCL